MKKIESLKTVFIIIMLGTIGVTISCTSYSDNEKLESNPVAEEKIVWIEQFKQHTSPIISQLAEKSLNFNTSTTRSLQADNDTLQILSNDLAREVSKLLEQNDLDISEFLEVDDSEYRLAYLALLLLDYEHTYAQNITRAASIGDCVLRAAGVGELVGKAVGKRTVMKILIKASLKRAVPYLGWSLAIGEGAACLAGY